MSKLAVHEGWSYVGEADLTLDMSASWIRYWRERQDASGRALLDRFDPPLDVPWLLDCIIWVEVLSDGDFLYRVVGTKVREGIGQEVSGKRLSAIDLGGFEQEIRKLFSGLCEHKKARFMRGFYVRNEERETSWEAAALPILNKDGDVTRILVGMAYRAPTSEELDG